MLINRRRHHPDVNRYCRLCGPHAPHYSATEISTTPLKRILPFAEDADRIGKLVEEAGSWAGAWTAESGQNPASSKPGEEPENHAGPANASASGAGNHQVLHMSRYSLHRLEPGIRNARFRTICFPRQNHEPIVVCNQIQVPEPLLPGPVNPAVMGASLEYPLSASRSGQPEFPCSATCQRE